MTVRTSDPTIEVPVPEPDLTAAVLLERARRMRGDLRDRQALTEELTRVSEETHQAFLRAGFYRMTQPRRFGGYQFGLRTFIEVITEIARGCPSSGWLLSLASGHSVTVAAAFSEHAQREIFGPEGDFRAPLPAAPTGRTVRKGDGYVVSGRWDYASGSPVSTHFLAVTMIDEGDGRPTPGLVCVPEGWEVLDNWGRTIGMRGSGSNSVVVHDAFVPEHFVVPGNVLDLDLTGGTVGSRLHDDPLYAGQSASYFNFELVPVMIGTALAALDEYQEILTTKPAPYVPGSPLRRELPEHQRNFALAIGLIESARRIILQGADDYLALARRGCEGGEPFSVLEDRRLSMSLRQAGLMATEAVEMIAAACGTSASTDGQRIQRYLRDVVIYRSHMMSQQGLWATDLGGRLLGAASHAVTAVGSAPADGASRR